MIINNIDTKDISVVVQGAIDKVNTPICLKSIRKYLPGAEIILSTWEGSEVDGLDYDILVLNEDPGNNGLIRKYPFEHINNVDRQIVSSYNGAKKSSKHYILKLRSDMELEGSNFLKIYKKFCNGTSKSFFKQRILVNEHTSFKCIPTALGDWSVFGLREDVVEYYNIPLFADKCAYFLENKNIDLKPKFADIVSRYMPEQWIVMQNIYKYNKDIIFDHFYNFTQEHIKITQEFILNNVICCEDKLSGIYLKKFKNLLSCVAYNNEIFFYTWYKLCKKNKIKILNLNFIQEMRFKLQKFLYKKQYKYNCDYLNFINYVNIIDNIASKDKKRIENTIKIERIKKRDITFVVSGRVDYNSKFSTISCLKSIRKYFANSKIILSTWQDSDLSKLNNKLYDEIVFSNQNETEILDIGYHIGDIAKNDARKNSYNLQQLLNKKGFDLVKTKYAVKFRTDLVLKSDNFLKFYNKNINLFDKVDTKYKLFKNRILIGDYWTIDSRTFFNNIQSFQVSDIFQFGLTDDLKKIWNGNVMDYSTANYFKDHFNSELFNPLNFNHLFNLEQFNILTAIKKSNLNLILPTYYADNREEVVIESEKFISSNFLIDTFDELNIGSKFNSIRVSNLFNYKRFIEIYLLHIDQKNENIKNIYKNTFIKEKIKKLLKKFKKHWKNFFQPMEKIVKRFFKWFGEFFAVLFYGVKIVLNVLCSFWK